MTDFILHFYRPKKYFKMDSVIFFCSFRFFPNLFHFLDIEKMSEKIFQCRRKKALRKKFASITSQKKLFIFQRTHESKMVETEMACCITFGSSWWMLEWSRVPVTGTWTISRTLKIPRRRENWIRDQTHSGLFTYLDATKTKIKETESGVATCQER